MLRSHDPDVIERLVERNLRRLRWNGIGAFGFMALFAGQFVVYLAVSSGRGDGPASLAFWAVKVARDRVGLSECAGRLVEHIKTEGDSARRTG